MQIGTRWAAGTQAPASIPSHMATVITELEQSDVALGSGMWTLTFLEQRPVATHQSGTVVALDGGGSVVVDTGSDVDSTWAGDDDDWLS